MSKIGLDHCSCPFQTSCQVTLSSMGNQSSSTDSLQSSIQHCLQEQGYQNLKAEQLDSVLPSMNFKYQIVSFLWLRRISVPLLLMVKAPNRSVSGLFRFAIHTITPGVFLYQMPKCLLLLLPEGKKPSSKIWPEEIKVWLPLIDCTGLRAFLTG